MYKHFCEDLFEYANRTFAEWSRDALNVVERHIKRPLLYRPLVTHGYIACTIEVSDYQKVIKKKNLNVYFSILFETPYYFQG